MKITYTLKARQDLQSIYEYIAFTLLVPETAQKITNTILEKIRTLDFMPEKNPLYKDETWHSLGVRFLPVKKYLVFFKIDNRTDTVYIVRIVYGGRDIKYQLEEL